MTSTLDFEEIALEEFDIQDEDNVFSVIEELTDEDRALIPGLVDVLYAFALAFSGQKLYDYQEIFARRFIESVVSNDGDELTALFSRQSGKTETVADVVAALMVLLPRLAKLPLFRRLLGKFANGVLVGTFAPVGDQADTLFERIRDRLLSPRAVKILADPEIDDIAEKQGDTVVLKHCRSLVRVQTAHPKAKIESKTYHIIVIDEAQGADERVVSKSISPMGASTNATKVMLGTPDVTTGIFHKSIRRNQRAELQRGGRRNHFQFDWKFCARANPNYAKYVKKEMARIGADSDEFRLAYKLEWILERGMFVTASAFEELGDKKMQRTKTWPGPCLVGIDPARKIDSTVVTVVWVDWERPNENGMFHHRVLDWLEMPGEGWEEQYFRILDFLGNYNVMAVGVDEGGMGDVIVDRLRHLLPSDIQVEPVSSSPSAQSARWKYLTELIAGSHPDYGHLLKYPAHASAKRTKTWRRFYQQMTELEKKYQGQYMLTEAPKENGAHDDFADSLAIACILSKDYTLPEIEVSENHLMSAR